MNEKVDFAVAIIAYRRPEQTKSVLEALGAFHGEKVYFFVDGPKNPEDEPTVSQVRQLSGLVQRFNLTMKFSARNNGLKNSVLGALDNVFQSEECSVILEDDCVPEADFFSFVARARKMLIEESDVAMISGNTFVHEPSRTLAYFSNQAHIWGWATSRLVWSEFRSSDLGLCEGRIPMKHLWGIIKARGPIYFKLRNLHLGLIAHKLDSWAIYFNTWIQANKKLVLHPPQNLVSNIGFGASATHTSRGAPDLDLITHPLNFVEFPEEVVLDISTMRKHAMHRVVRLFTYFLNRTVTKG